MAFCPKCGAPLKVEEPTVHAGQSREEWRERRREWRERRRELREQRREAEKGEKQEKGEKTEKYEKYEKHEVGGPTFMGSLVGGFILLFLGLVFYFTVTGGYGVELVWAAFFVIIGLLVIVGAVYAATISTRRHPRT
jgi:Flp pilus assembly protein TadB